MDKSIDLVRPELLQEGQPYYLRQFRSGQRLADFVLVTFWAYTSCPAAVIVRAADNSHLRCSRLELFDVSPFHPR